MRHTRFCLILAIFLLAFIPGAEAQINWKKINVLIYTRSDSITHEGTKAYIHDNIAACAKAVEALGKKHGFTSYTTNDASVFTTENLNNYTLVFFASTNNDAFNTDEQRLAFRRFVESGGGVVGMHSVMGTERSWTWFKNMLGGTFAWHAPNQVYKIINIRPQHPSMKDVPQVWEKKDECYFMKEMFPGIEVLMAHEMNSIDPKQKTEMAKWAGHYKDLYPAVWYHAYDGGHIWISQLGHDIANYSDPVFINHMFRGIQYIAGKVKKNAAASYATHRDNPLKF